MNSDEPIVFVVDDDHRVREALSQPDLLGGTSSGGLWLGCGIPGIRKARRARLPGPGSATSGRQRPRTPAANWQPETRRRSFLSTGHGDIPSSVRAMKAGAIEFLSKPFGEQELLQAIDAAIAAGSNSAAEEIGTGRVAEALRPAHASRTGSASLRGGGLREQADCRRAGHQRDHDRSSSRPDHAKDGRAIAGRTRQNGRQTRHRPNRWTRLNKPIIVSLRPLPLSSNRSWRCCYDGRCAKHVVAAVDDDFRVRESIESLVESAGYAPLVFSSAEEFLESGTLRGRCA